MNHDPHDSPEEAQRRLEFAGDWETLEGRLSHPHACQDCTFMFKDGLIGWKDIQKNETYRGCRKHTRHPYDPHPEFEDEFEFGE